MSIIKSSLDGIGTGAGVAWPFFGIISSTMGLAAGSSVALLAGSIAGILFCVITGVIFLLSYRNTQNKEHNLQKKLANAQDSLDALINSYLRNIFVEYQLFCKKQNVIPSAEEAIQFIKTQINRDLKSCDSSQINLKTLFKVLHEKTPLAFNPNLAIGAEIKKLPSFKHVIHFIPVKAISKTSVLQSAFLGAMGSFGAVAGCTAGFVGLLTGIGFISGFPAIPIIGWATLAIALGLALIVGFNSGKHAEYRHQLKNVKENTISLYSDLNKCHIKREIIIQAAQMVDEQLKANNGAQMGVFFRPVPSSTKDAEVQTEETPSSDDFTNNSDDETCTTTSRRSVCS